MKIFIAFFISILALSLAGCEKNTGPVLEKNKISNTEYFPLCVGNKWFYKEWDYNTNSFEHPEVITYDYIIEVTSKMFINDKLFYFVKSKRFNWDGSIFFRDSIYYSVTGDTVFQIRPELLSSQDTLSIKAILCDTGYVSFKMKWFDFYVSGRISKIEDSLITVSYWRERWMDSGYELKFKKGIGLFEDHAYSNAIGLKLVNYEILKEP